MCCGHTGAASAVACGNQHLGHPFYVLHGSYQRDAGWDQRKHSEGKLRDRLQRMAITAIASSD